MPLCVAFGLILFFLLRDPGGQKGFYRVLCMGDSLTASDYGQYTRHLKELFKEARINAQVFTAARPGNTSGEYLAYLKKTGVLSKYNPHLTVLMLGTNDVRIDGDRTPLEQYIQNMQSIIEKIKTDSHPLDREPAIFLVAVPPIFHCDLHTFDESSKQRLDREIVPAIRNLVRQEKLFLIDLYRFFQHNQALLPGIHPTAAGYRAMAGYIFSHLKEYIEKRKS